MTGALAAKTFSSDEIDPSISIKELIESINSVPEAAYIMHHIVQFATDQATTATRATAQQKEAEARIMQLEQQTFINEQLLESVIIDHNLDDYDHKIRRRATTAEELLYPNDDPSESLHSNASDGQLSDRQRRKNQAASASRLPPLAEVSPSTLNPSTSTTLHKTPSAPSLQAAGAPGGQRSVFARLHPAWANENSPSNILNRPLGPDDCYKKGEIVAAKDRGTGKLLRTAILDGHAKPVLAVDGLENLLVTGSKDRLAKLWDLEQGQEVATLGIHPNNVHAVKLVPNSHLAVTASMYQMRIWDLRENKCVRLFQSSGQVVEGDGGPIGSRQNTVPFLETVVNAIDIDPSGELLLSAFGGDVRVWSLSKMASFGRLVGAAHSPRSEVSCLSVALDTEKNVCNVFTGSRDHYVKMYTIPTTGEGIHEAKVEFNPPHYDNVTCIVSDEKHLFTASKDMNIMKINLLDYKRDHLELKAHNGYVQGMCKVPFPNETLLASVCKEGHLKLWETESTRRLKLVDTIEKAHQDSINSICYSSGLVFTASSDTTVAVWRPNTTLVS
ncbi:unnamed protein product, partial [Mesorhabditis spiculigera]